MTFQEQYGLMPGPNGPPSRPRYPPHQNAQPCHNWQPPPNQMGQRPYCENFRPPMGSMGPRQNYSPQRLPCRGPRPSGPRFEREPPFFPPHSAEGYRPGTMPPLPPPMGQTEYGPNQPVWETQFLPPACEQWPGGSAPGWPDGRNTMADDRQFSEADRRSVTSQPDGRQPESLCSSSDQACRLQDDTAQPRLEDDRSRRRPDERVTGQGDARNLGGRPDDSDRSGRSSSGRSQDRRLRPDKGDDPRSRDRRSRTDSDDNLRSRERRSRPSSDDSGRSRDRRSRVDDDESRRSRDRRSRPDDDDSLRSRRRSESVSAGRDSSSRSRSRPEADTRRDSRSRRKGDRKSDEEPPTNRCNEPSLPEDVSDKAEKQGVTADEKDVEEEMVPDIPAWTRCSPSDLYFKRDLQTGEMRATRRMCDLEDEFEEKLVKRASAVRATKPIYEPPPRPVHISNHHHHHHHHHGSGSEAASSSSSSSESSSDEDSMDEEIEKSWIAEMLRRKNYPDKLHDELWFNEKGEMNDGPLCRCSIKSRQSGIRHDVYPGEESIPACDMESNNTGKVFHYRVTMSPHTNFLTKNPTVIEHDNHEYIFEGFSLFSHYKIENVPVCKVIRFNIDYTIHWFEEDPPENLTVRSLHLFADYLFYEILELLDLDLKPTTDVCSRFHFLPRFVRDLPDRGKEILSMNEVLSFLLRSSLPLVADTELGRLASYTDAEWQDRVDQIRGVIVTYPGMRPSSLRIDQLDRKHCLADDNKDYPLIIHFGMRPVQLSYIGNPSYQRTWKQYVKLKHLLANKPKVTIEDKQKLKLKEDRLQEMKLKASMKREVTVELSSENFLCTGIKSDLCQHAFLLPVLFQHLRFHQCLDVLEKTIKYKFQNRNLLQLALTHPSYRINFGTNPDHARNVLANCGIRQPEYGDRRIHFVHSRKKGINTLIHIMARLGYSKETTSDINHNERLEFLGDAVVEFISTVHLFLMFPGLEEGGLAIYRAALVQNQHLSILAKKLQLQNFMLYAHGPDLCLNSSLRHARANCFEALMGALFLDGGVKLANRVYAETLFRDEPELLGIWLNIPAHHLQDDEPLGDRHWITSSPTLQHLVKFEDMIGVEFTHIRLLAKSLTMKNVGFNNLTCGHNQRLEFLGDTILQLITSAYLFRHYPTHHEGHLSLLRSSLVNNRNQAVICDDLGMANFIINADVRRARPDPIILKMKERADLVEAFIGALYIDKGLVYCDVFCNAVFFPRLKEFIMNQHWNDPKSQLQQCCLTLRELDGDDPQIPVYKMLESTGPTNTRKYTVAVYFRGERLEKGMGRTIQQAEMNAAANALKNKSDLFPQLSYQRKFIARKYSQHEKWREEKNGGQHGKRKRRHSDSDSAS